MPSNINLWCMTATITVSTALFGQPDASTVTERPQPENEPPKQSTQEKEGPASPAAEEKPDPIAPYPLLKKDPIQIEVFRLHRASMRHAILDLYNTSEGRKEALDEQVNEYIKSFIEWFGGWSGYPDRTWFDRQGKAITDAGCEDAAFALASAWARDDNQNARTALPEFTRAADLLEKSKYPRFLHAMARTLIARHHERWSDEATTRESGEAASQAWMQALREMSTLKMEPRFQFWVSRNSFATMLPMAAAQAAAHAIIADTAIDPWVAKTLLGEYERRAAWHARGNGFANTVTEEGWKGFRDHLDAASAALQDAYKLAPDRPEPASIMIAVSMGKSDRLAQKSWFDRAVAAQIDESEAYSNILWALRPRWGGSHEQMLALGDWCRQTARFDTFVPFQYIETLRAISEDTGGDLEVWRAEGRTKAVADVFYGYVRNKTDWTWYANVGIGACWRAGHYGYAYTLLKALEFKPRRELVEYTQVPFERVLRDAMTYGGPVMEIYTEANAFAEKQDFDGFLKKFEEAVEACKKEHPEVLRAAQSRLDSARMYLNFQKGEWVPMWTDETLSGLWPVGGACKPRRDEESVVLTITPQRDYFSMITHAQLGRRLEMEMDVAWGRIGQHSMAGLIVGCEWSQSARPVWQSITVHPTKKTGTVGPGINKADAEQFEFSAEPQTTSRLHITMWDDHIRVSVDGKEAFVGNIPAHADGREPGEHVGLCSFGPGVSIKNVRMKKLTQQPGLAPKF